MNVLIIGGTGLLGYHGARELLRRGHDVDVVGLPPAPDVDLFPDSVDVRLEDIGTMDDTSLLALVSPYDAIVFAAGVDDRATPPDPAYTFYYEANVRTSVRVTAAAREAGVGRMVILGSYFTYFDRTWPELSIADNHPYVYSRREQAQLCTAVAGSDVALIVLELPYIFGAMPGNVPLWANLVDYVRSGLPLYYTNGGTNMISVQLVAEAIAGALERVEQSEVFQVGDENVTWTRFLKSLCEIVGRDDDDVHVIGDDNVLRVAWVGDVLYKLFGREGGLHPGEFGRIQVAETYFDPQASRNTLGYGKGGLERAWRETVAACPEITKLEQLRGFVAKMQGLFGH